MLALPDASRRLPAVYEALDLTWIPPELRENRGEIAPVRRRDEGVSARNLDDRPKG